MCTNDFNHNTYFQHLELKEKQIQESLKKAIIDANCKHKDDEVEEYFQKHIEELEEKLIKAESLRNQKQRQTHRVKTYSLYELH